MKEVVSKPEDKKTEKAKVPAKKETEKEPANAEKEAVKAVKETTKAEKEITKEKKESASDEKAKEGDNKSPPVAVEDEIDLEKAHIEKAIAHEAKKKKKAEDAKDMADAFEEHQKIEDDHKKKEV